MDNVLNKIDKLKVLLESDTFINGNSVEGIRLHTHRMKARLKESIEEFVDNQAEILKALCQGQETAISNDSSVKKRAKSQGERKIARRLIDESSDSNDIQCTNKNQELNTIPGTSMMQGNQISTHAQRVLNAWYNDNCSYPYPKLEAKVLLASKTFLSLSHVL